MAEEREAGYAGDADSCAGCPLAGNCPGSDMFWQWFGISSKCCRRGGGYTVMYVFD